MEQINWHTFFFLLFSLITCGAAIAVVWSTSVVRMATWLILSLAGASGLYFLAGAEFVGAMQLMVYVGGTLVLLVFGVMLTARRSWSNLQRRGWSWLTAVIVGGTLLGLVLLPAMLTPSGWQVAAPNESIGLSSPQQQSTGTQIGSSLLGLRPEASLNQPGSESLAGYVLPFELISVYLLVVLIGSAYLARAKRSAPPQEHASFSSGSS